MKFYTILLALFLLLANPILTFAQALIINGKILDKNTHRPIAYTNVYIKGTQIGTISDFAGKFSFTIPEPAEKMILVVQHINYDIAEMPLAKVESSHIFYLQPRVIPLPEVQVEAKAEQLEIEKDLPQAVSMIHSSNFEIRGYVDAGDLLRTDQSVQVEEELSGKKTISIRGGNPEDVVVLYNGVKMNSEFNNIFDLSLIDLEDIERFELIKGSNTALYGSEAFSGVVNIVPKIQQDYRIRFQQRVGTYDSGNWGLHLYQNYKNLHGSYQLRQGGAERRFTDEENLDGRLANQSTHHTANLEYQFSDRSTGISPNSIGAMFIHSKLDYQKESLHDNESLANSNQMIGLRYSGNLSRMIGLNVSLSQRWLEESLFLSSDFGVMDRTIQDQSINAHTEMSIKWKSLDWLVAYQFENAKLDFDDQRDDFSNQSNQPNNVGLHRNRHGIVSILKIHAPSGSDILKVVDFDVSLRHDRVRDELDKFYTGTLPNYSVTGNQWDQTMVKFATYFSGYHRDYAFDIFMNIGTNFKFPTLAQIMSARIYPQAASLNPEKNQGVEIGVSLKRDLHEHPLIYGWQLLGNYIKNNYHNKFRTYYFFGIPYAFYDNVPDARISGFETKSSVFVLKKKITLELGFSDYSISEKSAFPFKYDMKRIVNFIVDHAGYSFQLHWFKEGEQIGWIRQYSGRFVQVILPEYANIDLHLSKTFELGRLKLFGNLSARNLLSDEFQIEGISLRDRRYYVTIGAQY